MKLNFPACHSKYFPLITVFIVIILYIHTLGKIFLNSGDHGRDLYDFLLTSQGALPYIDFHWVYGPLMPFYYAVFFKIFSPSVFTALLAWYLLFSLCLIVFYLLINKLVHPFTACLSTIIFACLHTFYFHTFNHIGGTLFVTVCIYFFISFITENKDKYLHATAISLFCLGLVKFNIMLAVFFSCLVVLFFFKKSKLIQFILISVIPLILVYGIFLYFIPDHNVYEIFPYKSASLTSNNENFLLGMINPVFTYPYIFEFKNPLIYFLYQIFYSKIFYFLTILIAFIALPHLKKQDERFYTILFLLILTLIISHEYFILGIDYNLRIWSLPSFLTLLILLLSYFSRDKEKFKKVFIGLGIIFTLGVLLFNILIYQNNFAYLNLDRANVSVYPMSKGNLFLSVTNFIMKKTSPSSTILAIPYNTLYVFLSERKSASKYNEFLYQTQQTSKQEREALQDLKSNKPEYILISNMTSEKQLGTGVFGVTHNVLLSKYFKENYSYIGLFSESFNKTKNFVFGEVIMVYKKRD